MLFDLTEDSDLIRLLSEFDRERKIISVFATGLLPLSMRRNLKGAIRFQHEILPGGFIGGVVSQVVKGASVLSDLD